MTLNSHTIPGDQKKKNTVKIEKYVNCFSDRKISSGECHSFYSCLSQLSEVPGLWTCLLCCLTGSLGEFPSHSESKISDEAGSFPHSCSSSSTFQLFKQEAQHNPLHFYKCWECRISLTTLLFPRVCSMRNSVTTQTNKQGYPWT